MTPEQRADGRRLLAADLERADGKFSRKTQDWLWKHLPALLADYDEISQAAVREFAEAIESRLKDASGDAVDKIDGSCDPELQAVTATLWQDCMAIVRSLAADRGVTLDEKP